MTYEKENMRLRAELEQAKANEARLAAQHWFYMPAYMRDCECRSCLMAREGVERALRELLGPTVALEDAIYERLIPDRDTEIWSEFSDALRIDRARLRAAMGGEA